MSTPNRENIRKWVDALRSGEFEQGRSRLRHNDRDRDRYCCLGVACEVYRRETGNGEWLTGLHGLWFEVDGRTPEEHYLHEHVVEWLGVDRVSPMAAGLSLTNLNDNGATFSAIADLIEREWLTPEAAT